MDVTTNLQRLSLKELLTTPEDAKAFFMNNELSLGLTSQTKPVRVTVNPSNDVPDGFGNRVSFYLPRYHFCQALELQFNLPALTAFDTDTDLIRNGYVRPVGALAKRIEIKYGSYSYIVPEDWLATYQLVYNSESELKKNYRSGGWVHGAPAQGTNRLGGSFTCKIPVPWEGSMLPIGALSGEITVDVWMKSRTEGFLETSYGARILSTLADAPANDGLSGNVTGVVALTALNPVPAIGGSTPSAPAITSLRLIAYMVNTDDATFSQVIEKVKTTGIAIPASEIQYVDVQNFAFSANGAPSRINLSQISGLVYGMFISIRDGAAVIATNGGHSVLKTLANEKDITFTVELNGQRLYSNEPVSLLQGAELIADRFKCSNMDSQVNRFVVSGMPFCLAGDKSIRNIANTGFVDLTNSSSAFLTLYNPAAASTTKYTVQVRALCHSVLIVDAAGLRRVNL
eukprot:tig00020904_g15213.t1